MIDRSPVWIALCDLSLALLAVALVCVNPPSKAKSVEQKAEFLLTASWPNTLDADIDNWAVGPSQKPIFYGARDVGCARLDQDDRGFLDGVVHLANGSEVKVDAFKETISLRCIEPGHWDAAVMLYAFHDHALIGDDRITPDRHGLNIPVHVELVALNPTVRVLYARDVTLDHVSQSINTFSFDLGRDGGVTMADPPLEPIVERWQKVTR
jgi:hypothetical protein